MLLAFASIAALGSVAHADDSITATATPAADADAGHTYVSVGANTGFVAQYLVLGGQVEVGHQLAHSPVSLHAVVATGEADELLSSGNGLFEQLRAGADVRGCINGALCAFAGTDVGYQHVRWTGDEGTWLLDEGSNTMTVTKDDSRLVGIGRVGLDIGGSHLRWRPGIEVALDRDGINNAEITQSIAYRW
jgi:hypothetical protein